MFKKTLAAAAVAALLVLGGSAAAHADYADELTLTATPPTITVGGSTTITASGLGDLETAYFGTDGTPGGSISSIVRASSSGAVAKTVVDGTATATFTASAPGTFTIAVGDGENVLATTTVTVTAASTGGGSGGTGGSGTLPATGGTVESAALWLGLGAIGIGGIAVAAVAARRRAHNSN